MFFCGRRCLRNCFPSVYCSHANTDVGISCALSLRKFAAICNSHSVQFAKQQQKPALVYDYRWKLFGNECLFSALSHPNRYITEQCVCICVCVCCTHFMCDASHSAAGSMTRFSILQPQAHQGRATLSREQGGAGRPGVKLRILWVPDSALLSRFPVLMGHKSVTLTYSWDNWGSPKADMRLTGWSESGPSGDRMLVRMSMLWKPLVLLQGKHTMQRSAPLISKNPFNISFC